MECQICETHRENRTRLIAPNDVRLREPAFLHAPYVHQNNEPKYHAMLLRSVEQAKHRYDTPRHILWVTAQDTPHNPKEISDNPASMQKKLDRFLQFHDQRTAGIPGIFPMYRDMRARVSEKLAKGARITILKHTPCTIIGWELHTADKLKTAGSQRVLQYLPRVIFLKFDNAEWEISAKLGKGVFPLKPVTRVWEVNQSTQAKISRKGFTLVPDVACTGFMQQGTTLDALIAECGDFLDKPGLTEMMTTYVILSRVRRATAILILRAFSLRLFQQGCPPGPFCLLKLLRARFAPTPGEDPYTPEQAIAEYYELAKKWDSQRNRKKKAAIS